MAPSLPRQFEDQLCHSQILCLLGQASQEGHRRGHISPAKLVSGRSYSVALTALFTHLCHPMGKGGVTEDMMLRIQRPCLSQERYVRCYIKSWGLVENINTE